MTNPIITISLIAILNIFFIYIIFKTIKCKTLSKKLKKSHDDNIKNSKTYINSFNKHKELLEKEESETAYHKSRSKRYEEEITKLKVQLETIENQPNFDKILLSHTISQYNELKQTLLGNDPTKITNAIKSFQTLANAVVIHSTNENENYPTISGARYEIIVADYYKNIGYEIQYKGITHGFKDEGIDLIATNSNTQEIIAIQCKYRNPSLLTEQYKITNKDIMAFRGQFQQFTNQNQNYKLIKAIYAIPHYDVLNYQAKERFKTFQKESKTNIYYQVIS